MVEFRQLLTFPGVYFKRMISVTNIKNIKINNIEKNNDNIKIMATVNKHDVEIHFHDTQIKQNTPVSVVCTCESFKFEFAYTMNQQTSLIGAKHFILDSPKKKNTNNIISGCKHIIALAIYIQKNKHQLIK